MNDLQILSLFQSEGNFYLNIVSFFHANMRMTLEHVTPNLQEVIRDKRVFEKSDTYQLDKNLSFIVLLIKDRHDFSDPTSFFMNL